MRYRSFFLIIGLLAIAITVPSLGTIRDEYLDSLNYKAASGSNISNKTDLIAALGWIKDATVCGGHYSEVIDVVANPAPSVTAPIAITASQPAFFTKDGTSILRGDAKLSQPGREVTAQHMVFFRDKKTGRVKKAILSDNVNFHEADRLVIAKKGILDFTHKEYVLHEVIYRLLSARTPTGLTNVWGRAKNAISNVSGILKLSNATYTGCAPDSVAAWHLYGKKLTLNRDTGRGDVVNAKFYFKNMPIFYMPYFNFPIDKRRKSGFLTPSPSYSQKSGVGIDLPYYFNLAPNYDIVLTPQFFAKRGILFDILFRHLHQRSRGVVNFSYIPYDNAFVNFRNAAVTSYPAATDPNPRALTALKSSHDSRVFFSLQNDFLFDKNWRSSFDINYVSDNYFLRDFGDINNIITNGDQLLNRVDISYFDYNWSFLGRLQIFQTLHQLHGNRSQEQYIRLPQLNLSGDFADGLLGLDYRLENDIVNFMRHNGSYRDKIEPVTGLRFNVKPSVATSFDLFGGYVTPNLQLQVTGYDLNADRRRGSIDSIMRVCPLLAVDSGVVLRRSTSFFKKSYTQTLEPRLFYLFVPTVEQKNIPMFDTHLPTFSFEQLFRYNRFSGVDRIGDANQVALAITTRFLDEYGQEKFRARLGQIFSMHKHEISTGTFDPLVAEKLSPLVGKFSYAMQPHINMDFDMAWNPRQRHLSSMHTNLRYTTNPDHVVNFWYHYAFQGDEDLLQKGKKINLSRLGFSGGWKIWKYWNIIGSLGYNVSCVRAQKYIYGLEYNGCCWAVRLVHGRDFIGVDMGGKADYDSRVYIQFLLKGVNSLDIGGGA